MDKTCLSGFAFLFDKITARAEKQKPSQDLSDRTKQGETNDRKKERKETGSTGN